MMTYTLNQTAEPLDLFMDDMMVLHTEGPIVRVDDYYPFGMTYRSSERSGFVTNKFLYNEKELQTDLDLDWYDYGSRMYDMAVGRWHVVDPLADQMRRFSPYNYAFDNPVRFIDPDGKRPDDYYNEKGEYLHTDTKATDEVRIIKNDDWEEIKNEYAVELMDRSETDLNLQKSLEANIVSIEGARINAEAISNIVTDVLSKMDNVDISKIMNNKVSVYTSNERGIPRSKWSYNGGNLGSGSPFSTNFTPDGKIQLTVRTWYGDRSLISTRSNIQNAVGIHKYLGHGINGITEANHSEAYKLQFQHESY